ncbi:hypothetical protein QQS21_009199 [Conoideocrella luteorostrata]|uniref:Secreted protein n=1 Tax=Conoideocrella luteorostrata TaxID=1105319 RepID=A0AAJ0CHL3_9HYPO|nr:hypothetical protein QQS21_009199 [Conoideocrella luteorostrata]
MVHIFIAAVFAFATSALTASPATTPNMETSVSSAGSEPIEAPTADGKGNTIDEKNQFVELVEAVLEKAKEEAGQSNSIDSNSPHASNAEKE